MYHMKVNNTLVFNNKLMTTHHLNFNYNNSVLARISHLSEYKSCIFQFTCSKHNYL